MVTKEIVLTEKDIDRFWTYVNVGEENECWEWTGGTFDRGYGAFHCGGKTVRAHRVAWVISNGRQIQDKMVIAHAPIICHNVKCCNPKHLRETTELENIHDRDIDGTTAKGDDHFTRRLPEKLARGDDHWSHKYPDRVTRGERVGGSRWTEQDIKQMRSMYGSGEYTQVEIAKIFNTKQSRISEIVLGKLWKHVKESGAVYG